MNNLFVVTDAREPQVGAMAPPESLPRASNICRIGAGGLGVRGRDIFRPARTVQRHELQQSPEHGVAKGQGGVRIRSAKEMAHVGDS